MSVLTKVMKRTSALIAILLASVLLSANVVYADSSAHTGEIEQPERVIPFAKQIEVALAERGARAAIVARQGRNPDQMPDGIDYTHVGIWIYSDITLENGQVVKGYAIHNLYQNADDNSRSHLAQDYPAEFFSGVHALKAGVAIPSPELQERLIAIVQSDTYAKLHVPNYSLVANPDRRTYQNCTNFVMNVIVSALYDEADPAEVTKLLASNYRPTPIALSGILKFVGNAFVRGFETDDHEGEIYTSTFASIVQFLEGRRLLQEEFIVEEREA